VLRLDRAKRAVTPIDEERLAVGLEVVVRRIRGAVVRISGEAPDAFRPDLELEQVLVARLV